MRIQEGYNSVFSERLPIGVWPILVNVYKSVDAGLANIPSARRRGERFINTWRPLVALLVVGRRMKTFAYRTAQLLEISDNGEITSAEVEEVWNLITSVDSEYDSKKKIKPVLVRACCEKAANTFGLAGIEELGRRSIQSILPNEAKSAEFLEKVDKLLPAQPWKPGVHLEIAGKLGCKSSEVGAAIQQLIAEGKRDAQIDGVVYDSAGKVIAVDPERTPAEEK
jgi:hypothetical protein